MTKPLFSLAAGALAALAIALPDKAHAGPVHVDVQIGIPVPHVVYYPPVVYRPVPPPVVYQPVPVYYYGGQPRYRGPECDDRRGYGYHHHRYYPSRYDGDRHGYDHGEWSRDGRPSAGPSARYDD
ncbi:MAG: hypothetical protein HY308_09525 [Gammaproteobacteria bacterium]|nr:hypothetical protein [Gammaproteobacteria bacterium]